MMMRDDGNALWQSFIRYVKRRYQLILKKTAELPTSFQGPLCEAYGGGRYLCFAPACNGSKVRRSCCCTAGVLSPLRQQTFPGEHAFEREKVPGRSAN
jgi:hypothetical protein